jgi:DNA-binding Lrp family transcriptional regulator
MAVKGYLLIEAKLGKADQVIKSADGMEGIVSIDKVSGSWDVIAVVTGESIKDIGELVVGKIRKIEGIEKTLTCFVV